MNQQAGYLVAGVDSSTQSCKVELRDAESGVLCGSGTAPHPPTTPPVSEQDPAAWWDAFVTAFRTASQEAGAQPGRVVAISVGAQCHGMVALDSADQVIRPAKLWNDTTSSPQWQSLRRRIGDESLISTLGSLPTAAFTISKIAWLQENEPESFQRLDSVLLPHDYLTWRLTGEKVTDRSEASGTGYYNSAKNKYVPEFLSLIDADKEWSSALPKVLGPDETAGTLTQEALDALGLSGTVLVGAGGGDQHISALGLGIDTGDVVYSFGTSGVVFSTQQEPVYDELGYVNGVANCTGGYLPLICTLNAARVIGTFTRLMNVTHDELSELALAAPRNSNGPALAAFLDGERTPNRPTAAGVLAGITTGTSREELARSAYEGVVLGLVSAQRELERAKVRTDGRIIAIGGGARSFATVQTLADLLEREVFTAEVQEAVARGAAVQAAAVFAGRSAHEQAQSWRPDVSMVATAREMNRDPWAGYRAVVAVKDLDGLR